MPRTCRTLAISVALVLLSLGLGCAKAPSHQDLRVLLIGVDGLDLDLLDELIGKGLLPTFARLRDEGAFGPLRSREPLLSPLVWTTVATGRVPHDHGILDFVEASPDGDLVPITSSRRQVPALWNIATEYGVSSGFVGWYATYPAEVVDGFQVSDRIGLHQVVSTSAETGTTFPASLAHEIRDRFGSPEPDVSATRARFLDDPEAPVDADGERRLIQLAKIHATAELYRQAAPMLVADDGPALLGIYFELVDACGHLFMENAPPKREGTSDRDFHAFSRTVERCYIYQDEVLAELLSLAGPETVTAVCSDHGFKSGAQRPRTSGRADTGVAGLWHRLHGVLFLHGRGITPGTTIEGATILDLAPTILGLLGIPQSREMPGRALREVFAPTAWSAPETVDRYTWQPQERPTLPSAASQEAVDKLRALGYLGAGGETIAHDAEGRTAGSYVNEGGSRAADGDVDGALRAFSRAVDLDPQRADALAYAARLYTERGDLEKAAQVLERAATTVPDNLFAHIERGRWALRSGDWALADQELRAAERLDDRLVPVLQLRAQLLNVTGRSTEALTYLDRAISLTAAEDLLTELLVFQARVAAEAGKLDAATAAVARARQWVDEASLAAVRGDIALAGGQFSEAATYFEAAVQTLPDDATLERKLGQAQAGAGSFRAAEASFRRALEKAQNGRQVEGAYGDLALLFAKEGRAERELETLTTATENHPKSSVLWSLLGAAHGRRGALDWARDAYQRSVDLMPTALTLKSLAALRFENGERQQAVTLWRQSLVLDPDQRDVRAFLDRYAPE